MRAPDFWTRTGQPSRALLPLGWLWTQVTRRRLARTVPERADVPVICVGNITAGGVGKTPVCLDLGRRIAGAQFLTRGHGGREKGPLSIDAAGHSAHDVGDEALLLARVAPTWLARHRPDGARAAVAAGATAIVMDDGFQNPTLAKDLSLVVVDGPTGFGNQRVIPSGPCREPIADGLARADAVVIMGPDAWGVERRIAGRVPVLKARLVPGSAARSMAGQKVVAFAGIGRPGKFFDMLRLLGAQVLAAHPFPDHHPYADDDVQPILDEAYALSAFPVTTEKDAVRLAPDQRGQVTVLTVAVEWEDEGALLQLLSGLVACR